MASEKEVRLASRLYEARETIRRLLGDGYSTVLEPYRNMLRKVMAANDCDEIAAALWTASRVDRHDRMEVIKILAAAVEMIEPTQVPQPEKQP